MEKLVLPGTGAQQEAPDWLDQLMQSMQSMLQHQKAELVAAIQTCEEEEARLDQYQSKLDALLKCSRNNSLLVQDVKSRAAAKRDEIQQVRQQLQALPMESDTSRWEIYKAIEDAVRVTKEAKLRTKEAKLRAEESQALFLDEKTIIAISGVTEVINKAVEAVSTTHAAMDIPGTADAVENVAQASSSSLMNTQQTLQPPPLMTKDCLGLTESARQQLHAGRVYAVQRTQGQTRYGRITIDNEWLCMDSLKDGVPPPGAITVQVEEVVPYAAPCLVFLDLAWPGTTPRRVLIRLTPDTPHGLQFLLMCTGQRGHSYVNTTLFRVWRKGEEGECVCGGYYERCDGRGGRDLVPDLDAVEYQEAYKAGDVWWGWWWDNINEATQFNIMTRDMSDDSKFIYSELFGKVVRGLEHVREAVHHMDKEENKVVTVVRCGVVLNE